MRWICLIGALALVCTLAGPADAGAIRSNAGFDANDLARNDDLFTGLVPVGFTGDFYDVTGFTHVYVNNNGNITLDSPMSTYTPFPILTTTRRMIAPFFADVDTRRAGDLVRYGTDTVDGHAAFGVNWIDVDYYYSSGNHWRRNSFQLVLIDRSDIAPGDFDIEFNYDQIQWETGDASSGSGGLGGYSARVGWTDGSSEAFELPGSAVNGAFLDTGPAATALIHNSLNSPVLGRYLFEVRGGTIIVDDIPEPGSIALLGLGLGFVGTVLIRRRRRS